MTKRTILGELICYEPYHMVHIWSISYGSYDYIRSSVSIILSFSYSIILYRELEDFKRKLLLRLTIDLMESTVNR